MDNSLEAKNQDETLLSASPRLRVSASSKFISVKVLFFGATAQAVGEREIEMELADETRAENAFARVVERFPALEKHSLLFAVNQEYAKGDETIRDGDELAVFTHVSGG